MPLRTLLALLTCCGPALAGAGAVPGYQDAEAFSEACHQLAESELVDLQVIGQTAEGREVLALTIGGEHPERRPAILVVGSVQADSLVGSKLLLGMVELLINRLDEGDPQLAKLLKQVTLYVIPRPSPDASQRFFAKPYLASATNQRPMDDDRDGRIDEDPPADLNGDGWITQMRVLDPTGEWIEHPDDPRVMIKADPTKGEAGRYRLLTEDDADNDNDQHFAEDAIGGVDFNRNFTFKYPYFKPGAGPHQVSEPESRAVADFAFDHPNIFLVVSFSPQANLIEDWKSGGDADGVTSTVADRDAPYFKWLAEKYRDRFELKGAPKSAELDGSFAAWAYFHYGRWSLSAPGWHVPEMKPETKDDSEETESEQSESEKGADASKEESKDKKKPVDDRGKQELRVLAWLDRQEIDGFVPWTKWEGPMPKGLRGSIEVGGFKPFVSSHPPVEQLDELADEHLDYLIELAKARPLVVISEPLVESRGSVHKQEVTVINRGFLPTVTRPGERSGKVPRLEVTIEQSEETQLLAGPRRRPVGRLEPGESESFSWLLQTSGDTVPWPVQLGFAYQRDETGKLPAAEVATPEVTSKTEEQQ